MSTPADKQSFARLQVSQNQTAEIIPKLPALPDDVRKRFPSLYDWERDVEKWRLKVNVAIRGGPNN